MTEQSTRGPRSPARTATPPPLLGVVGLAEYLGVPVNTVYNWRIDGRGPRAIKVGKHLRFRPQDVEAWLEQHADPDA
jgi:excisionase family DNA binding protein